MFHVGDVIVYGVKGVYKVEAIGVPQMEWLGAEKEYYILQPLFRTEKIFTPVDTTVYMRSIISSDEALELIRQIPEIHYEKRECRNPRSLESSYQEAFDAHDSRELIKVIKKTHEKKQKAISSGKKLAQIDERYMRRAENLLYEELAAAIGIERDSVPGYIQSILAE